MSQHLPLILRPAWRNYWHMFTLATIIFLASIVVLAMSLRGSLDVPDPLVRIGFGAGMLAALGLLITAFEKRYSKKFILEPDYVIEQYGIVSRNRQSVPVASIRSVELEQSATQRMFNVGDIQVYTAGSGESEVHFQGVLNPMRIKEAIRYLSEQALLKQGQSNGGNGGGGALAGQE